MEKNFVKLSCNLFLLSFFDKGFLLQRPQVGSGQVASFSADCRWKMCVSYTVECLCNLTSITKLFPAL